MKIDRWMAVLLLVFILPFSAYARVINVGVSFYDPPFVILGANNQFYGFDISLIQHLCKTLKYQCQFTPMRFGELLKAVETNKVDLAVSSIIITSERAARVSFSSPYLVSKTRFITFKQPKETPFTTESLVNKKIGVSDMVFVEQLKSLGVKKSQISLFKDDNSLVQALKERNINLALLDNPTAFYWQQHSSGLLKIQGKPMLFGLGLGIAVSPSQEELLGEINKALLKYQSSDAFINDFHKYLSHLPPVVIE